MTYQLTASKNILRNDGASIPADPANSDYQAYLAWIAEGNTPTPYTPPAPTIEQQMQALESSVTPRMLQEAVMGSALTFPADSPFAGKTSAQAISSIRSQIDALRADLPKAGA